MSKISVQVQGYSGDYIGLNGKRDIVVSRRDILKASLTLGFQNFGEFRNASRKYKEHRIYEGLKALNGLYQTSNGWTLDDFQKVLDSSEKGSLSYWQGMIFAKIAASKVLGVPWLANVDGMKDQGNLTTDEHTKERGDLVGLSSAGKWHVVEAKGRSTTYSSELIDKAKQQASRISSVFGHVPDTHAACVSSLWEDPIQVILDDPPSDGEETIDFEESYFWKRYYGGLINYIREFQDATQYSEAFPGYTFATLKPLFPFLEDDPFGSFNPLPTVIGLPNTIMEDPTSAPLQHREEDLTKAPIKDDGIVLAGPFAQWKNLKNKFFEE